MAEKVSNTCTTDFSLNRYPIYYDAEFTGLHRDTDLISIGLVTEDSRYFYAEFNDYSQGQVTGWLAENVISRLPFKNADHFINNDEYGNVRMKGSSPQIAARLLDWLESIHKDQKTKLQFYTDCYAWDWVLFNDLVCTDGLALNLPGYIDYIPMDLCTTLQLMGIDPDVNREVFAGSAAVDKVKVTNPFTIWDRGVIKHNSLWDAFICKKCFERCNMIRRDGNAKKP